MKYMAALQDSKRLPRNASIAFHLAALLTFFIYALYRLTHDDLFLFTLFSLAFIPISISLVLEIKHRGAILHKQITLILVCITIAISCYSLGYKSLIYVFPTIFIFFFIFNFKNASSISSFYVLICLISALNIETYSLVWRFGVAMFDCIIFAAIFAYIIAKQKAALIYLATTDELTGALNRKNLATSLSSSIESFQHKGTDTSLLLIDIDHFKTVNDTYGHLVGDKLLTQFSEVLKRLLPAEAKLFRFGGEEFLVQCEHCDLQKALEMAQRLKQAVNQTDFDGVPVNVSCSIGVAELRINDSLEEWLKQSDIALYAAKKSGRNRVVSRLDK